MSPDTGLVFAIERCSLHDGPGIRTTVFLKGCPLHCLWCHNPESISPKPELYFLDEKCTHCGACVPVCPNECHAVGDGEHAVDRSNCDLCGKCVEVCPVDALEIKGKPTSVADTMAEVLKDRHYYEESGGGVTISGGEPMAQFAFTKSLLKAAHAEGIHTVIETSGMAPTDRYLELAPLVSLFLIDWKETDPKHHKEFTGVDNKLIRANILALDAAGAKVLLRCPVIPSLNDRPDHFAGIADLANHLTHVQGIEIMPYHPMGRSKSAHIGKTYPLSGTEFTGDDVAEGWRQEIRKGTKVKVS